MSKTAVILCAGKGTRMGDLCTEVPKCLLPYRGIVFLWHILDRLYDAGAEKIVLVIGHLGEQIKRLIGTQFRREENEPYLPVEYIEQKWLIGTGYATFMVQSRLRQDFLLTYGDILVDVECYREVLDRICTLAVNQADPKQGAEVIVGKYGSYEYVESILEKPTAPTTMNNSAGIYHIPYFPNSQIFAPTAWPALLDGKEWCLTHDIQNSILNRSTEWMVVRATEWIHIENETKYREFCK